MFYCFTVKTRRLVAWTCNDGTAPSFGALQINLRSPDRERYGHKLLEELAARFWGASVSVCPKLEAGGV